MNSLSTAELAGLVQQVGAMPAAVDDGERIDRIRHFEELKSALSAAQMATAVEFADSRKATDAERGVPPVRRRRSAAAEVGLALRVSPNQAARWLGLARILQAELPATFAELAAGRTSEWRAMLVARESIFLSREHRAIVDNELAPRLSQLGDRKVEAEARRAAQRLDPAGAAERARNAVNDRRVSLRPAPDTMCRFSALLPVAQGVAAYAAIKQHADTLIGTGQQGTNPDGSPRAHGQVMADTVVQRLTGQTVAEDVPVEINLVMTDTTLFQPTRDGDQAAADADSTAPDTDAVDEAGEPGILVGYGPIPAPIARDLALGRANSPAARWIRRLFLDPDRRRLVDQDTRRREFSDNQRRFIRLRDQDTCRTPWCGAPIRHLDHIDDWAHSKRTSVTNGQGYCAACNYAKQSPGWRTRLADDGSTIITTTPSGHRYESPAPAPPGARPPGRLHRPDTERGSPVEQRLRELLGLAA